MSKQLRITQIKSKTGYDQKQRLTIKALGIKGLSRTVIHRDTPQIRGMINKVKHLLKVEEV